ncbi:Fc.00g030150.m01.CDS01 [Cosmosporella sp. VM-42]
MFPPVDDAILQQNPDFANLYGKLTNLILNPDGSTKEDPAAKERAAVGEELNKRRLKTAKQHLLTRAISTATPPDSKPPPRTTSRAHSQPSQATPPEPLLDLLLILPPLLSPEAPLPQDSLTLLFSHPPLANLEALIPELTPILSSTLRSSALGLVRLTHPTTNPSFLHRHISALPQALATLQTDLSAAEAALTTQRLRTLASLAPLLRSYTQGIMHLMRALESKHGVIARSLELRASEVALQAQRHEVDAQQTMYAVQGEVYTPEMITALKNYAAHLRDAKIRGEERIRGLRAELGEYGIGVDGGEGKEKMMREMARVYREMGRQMDDVENDLERLHHG